MGGGGYNAARDLISRDITMNFVFSRASFGFSFQPTADFIASSFYLKQARFFLEIKQKLLK